MKYCHLKNHCQHFSFAERQSDRDNISHSLFFKIQKREEAKMKAVYFLCYCNLEPNKQTNKT